MGDAVNDELREAAEAGNLSLLKALLLRPKCDPMSMRSGGQTALMHAASNGHFDCVRLLLPLSDAGAKSGQGVTALMHAAAWGHRDCVQILIPASDALAQDQEGRTALIFAAIWRQPSCIQLLLPVSDLVVKDGKGMTASDNARDVGNKESAELIDGYMLAMKEGARLNASIRAGAPRKSPTRRV